MENNSIPKDEKLIHEDIDEKEKESTEKTATDDDKSENKKSGAELNKSKKGHVVDLNSKIRKTEERIEKLNESIAGDGIFDY